MNVVTAEWFFEPVSEWGNAGVSAMRNPLSGADLEIDEKLAREVIQNSVDARATEASKPRVVFRKVTLSEAELRRFVDMIYNGTEWQQHRQAVSASKVDAVTAANQPLSLLFIEDFETHGLYGDHLRRLLLELGDDAKVRNSSATGGSYGYGKSVLLVGGGLDQVFAYSVFEPTLDGSDHYSKLLGVGYGEPHTLNGKAFTGKACFGVPVELGRHFRELQDQEADLLAQALMFPERERNQTGTTICIPSPRIDMSRLTEAIEKWWWPRLVSDGLDIEIFEDGVRLDPPRPRMRSYLRPYVEAFDLLRDDAVSDHKAGQTVVSLRKSGVELGRLGLRLNRYVPETDGAESDDDVPRLGEVALVRGPLMVVRYLEAGEPKGACSGVFMSDSAMEQALRFSENPAHTDWSEKSERLSEETQRKSVAAVRSEVRKAYRRFAGEAQLPPPDKGLRVPALERVIGRALRLATGGGRGGAISGPPVHIRIPQLAAEPVNRGLSLRGNLLLKLDEKFDGDKLKCLVSIECWPKEDGGSDRRDPLRLELRGSSVALPRDEQANGYVVEFQRGQPVELFLESEVYSPEWTVQLSTGVTVLERETAN